MEDEDEEKLGAAVADADAEVVAPRLNFKARSKKGTI